MIPLFFATALAARPHWEPQSGVTERYNLAVMALSDSRPGDALDQLAPVLSEDPDCGLCQHAQAVALLRTGQPDAARAVLEPLSLLHDRSEVHTLRAVTAATLGDHESARNAAMRAVNQQPGDLVAQRALLAALLRLDERTEAQRVLQLAARNLSRPEAACLGVEYALAVDNIPGARGAMSQCQGADDVLLIQELQLKLARVEGDLETLHTLAQSLGLTGLAEKAAAAKLLRNGQPDAALARLSALLQTTPDDPDALLLRAQCHRARGATNDGLLDLDRIASLSTAPRLGPDGGVHSLDAPEHLQEQASALRIMLLLDDGRTEDARIILDRQGVDAVTGAASVRLLLEEQGVDEAAAALERIIRQWPDAPQLPQVALRLTAHQPPSPALIGWVQSLPDREHAVVMAAQQHHQANHSACSALLAPLSDPRSLALAHRCAVALSDLSEADRLLEGLTRHSVTPEMEPLMRHAWLHGEAGSPGQGLALLADTTPPEPLAEAHRSLRVWLSVEDGALKSALAVESEGPIAPHHRAHLARALFEAGSPITARTQMRQACRGLTDADQRQCHKALSLMTETP